MVSHIIIKKVLLMGVEEGVDLTGVSVAVVVVNYNAGALLSEAVMGVLASTVPVEVFVVDNGSSDNSIEILQNRIGPDPRLYIIETGRNLGFAKAANARTAANCTACGCRASSSSANRPDDCSNRP